jgi:hypothetical protein
VTDDKGDADLQRSTKRLGDRFGTTSDESETRSDAATRNDSSSAGDESASANATDTSEPNWVPTTLYLPEETRREFRRFLKRLTLDYPEIEDAQKRELHTALVRAGMEDPEAVADFADEQVD